MTKLLNDVKALLENNYDSTHSSLKKYGWKAKPTSTGGVIYNHKNKSLSRDFIKVEDGQIKHSFEGGSVVVPSENVNTYLKELHKK
jgi:hypothetical protein